MSSNLQRKLYDSTDCMASALALNCCQFGCLIRNVPVSSEYGVDNSDWMDALRKARPSLKLRDVVMPGTHDSATYTFPWSKPFSASGLTQNVDIYSQLSRGVRYLDVRVASSSSGTSIYHGCLQGGKLQPVLDQCKRFLDEHTGEFLVLDVVQEYGRTFHHDKRIELFELLSTFFGDKLYKTDDRGALLETPLGELDKQVVILLNNRIYNFEVDGVKYTEQYVDETYGIFSAQRWMQNKWHNTRDVSQLLEWNLDEVHKNGDKRNRFLTNQFVLSPGVGSAKDVFDLLVGSLSLRPVSFATKLYQKDTLDDFMRQHADEPWNIVMLDYVDLIPALVSFLIGINFVSPLTVTKAAAHAGIGESIDVTEKCQSYIKRGSVLYLTDIRNDFGLDFDEGKLTIAYKIGDGPYRILDVDFDESTEILVGEYSQNEGVLVHIDAEHAPTGVYSGGKVIVEEQAATASNGTVLQYAAKAEDVEFSIVR